MIEKTTKLPMLATAAYLVFMLALVISMFVLDGFYSIPVFQQMASSAWVGSLMWLTFSGLLVLAMQSISNKSLGWSARIAAAICVFILLVFNIVSTFGGVLRQTEQYKELSVLAPPYQAHLQKLQTQEKLNEKVLLEKQADAYKEGQQRIVDVTAERLERVELDFKQQIADAEKRLNFESRNGKIVVGERYREARDLLEGLRSQKSALTAQIATDETTALATLNSENLKSIAAIKQISGEKQAAIEADFKNRLAASTGSVIDLIQKVVNSTFSAFASNSSIKTEQAAVFLALSLSFLLLLAIYVASTAFLSVITPYVKSAAALSHAKFEIDLALKKAQVDAINQAMNV